MKNKEVLSLTGAFLLSFAIFTSRIWMPPTVECLRLDKPPETEQVVEEVAPPTAEQVEQEKLLEQVKKAGGSSVVLRTESLGDEVKPLIVRHYARYTETGSVEYWTELID